MRKPTIGILSSRVDIPIPNGQIINVEYINQVYCEAVLRAGGIPILLPVTSDPEAAEQMFSLCSGMLFPGGVDVDPRFYGEAPDPLIGTLNYDMDRFWLQGLEYAQAHL